MQTALKVKTHVLPGRRVEIVSPELIEGEAVEVTVARSESALLSVPSQERVSLLEFLDSLPPGPRSAPTWGEIERNLQEDRDSWDR